MIWALPLILLICAVIDYIAFSSKGRFFSIIFIAIALGVSVVGLLYIPASPITQHSAIIVTDSSGGNTITQPYNTTVTMPDNLTSIALAIGTLNAMVQAALVILVIGFWIIDNRNKKRPDNKRP